VYFFAPATSADNPDWVEDFLTGAWTGESVVLARSDVDWVALERVSALVQPILDRFLSRQGPSQETDRARAKLIEYFAFAHDLSLEEAAKHPDLRVIERARALGKPVYAIGRTVREPHSHSLPAQGLGLVLIEPGQTDPATNARRFLRDPTTTGLSNMAHDDVQMLHTY
jgi:hypothetical protein